LHPNPPPIWMLRKTRLANSTLTLPHHKNIWVVPTQVEVSTLFQRKSNSFSTFDFSIYRCWYLSPPMRCKLYHCLFTVIYYNVKLLRQLVKYSHSALRDYWSTSV
jgi:hypothetical protein